MNLAAKSALSYKKSYNYRNIYSGFLLITNTGKKVEKFVL